MLSFSFQNEKKKIFFPTDQVSKKKKSRPGWRQTNIFLSLVLFHLIHKNTTLGSYLIETDYIGYIETND